MNKKLFLIDGTALIYRAYFAFIRNPLYTSEGMNTSAMFGTFNMFLSFVDRFRPEYVMISFDRKEKTFRHELDENYKKNRPPAPDEMIEQFEPIKDFFRYAGVKEISIAGYEADDILASMAERFKEDFEVIIVTGDKDFAQVVQPNVKIYDPKKETITDAEGVIEKYGVTAEQFIDYLAICGDTADNIPGVKGIGPKGASKLLQEYNDLDGIYANLENIKSKSVRAKLEENKDNAYLSRQLAAIVTDLALDVELKELDFNASNLENTLELLRKYELNSIAGKIQPPQEDIFSFLEEDGEEAEEFQAVLVNNDKLFAEMLQELAKAKIVAMDTETTSTDPIIAELVGISICADDRKAYYIPVAHQMADNIEKEKVKAELTNVLADKLITGHNFKYDYLVLKQNGWNFMPKVFDTMIADYLLEPMMRHSLDKCADRYFQYSMMPISELIGKGKKQITFDLVSTQKAAFYSGEDAWVTWRLYHLLSKRLHEMKLEKLFEEVEMPLLYSLAYMEREGVYIDEGFLKSLSAKIQSRIAVLIKSIYELAGEQFNLNSTQQLSHILFEKMEIPPKKKTKTGYSVDQSVLEQLQTEYEIAGQILEYRSLNKLDSTYVSALPKLINAKTGRIHSSFNQTVASTGRLSSSNPNLQNIPIRSELGKEVRKAFTVRDNSVKILAADYSQIELRVFAILTRDETLINTFRNDLDIHSKTASIIYNVSEDEVSADMRRYAKVINFGLLYGMGAFRISNELNISRKEAQEFIDNYFKNFPSVRNFIDKHLQEATEKGYVETILGRRLYLPDLKSKSNQMRKAAERVAVNMPVQGSAADLIKIAMNNLYNKIKDNDKIRMLIQVHDELVFEVKKEFLEEAEKIVRETMEDVLPDEFKDIVPLKVDIGIGDNWFEAH